jgi:hypothetical protein
MFRSLHIVPDSPCVASVRAEIGARPTVQLVATCAAQWERYADEALARGEVGRAAHYQELAAVAAHQLGLLEDALLAVLSLRRRCTEQVGPFSPGDRCYRPRDDSGDHRPSVGMSAPSSDAWSRRGIAV